MSTLIPSAPDPVRGWCHEVAALLVTALAIAFTAALNQPPVAADQHSVTSTQVTAERTGPGEWGDQGIGTYRNPVVNSDFSDPDVIRVG
jgi:hypothetical protein